MEIKEQLDIKGLETFYLFANTPSYLYRNFRSNETVSSLIVHNQLSDLLATYMACTEAENRPIENVVIAYAILVSFTFLEPKDAKAAFDQVDLSTLDWGYEIENLFTASIKSTTSVQIKLSPEVTAHQVITSDSSTIQMTATLKDKS
jgi:hypothetical protein